MVTNLTIVEKIPVNLGESPSIILLKNGNYFVRNQHEVLITDKSFNTIISKECISYNTPPNTLICYEGSVIEPRAFSNELWYWNPETLEHDVVTLSFTIQYHFASIRLGKDLYIHNLDNLYAFNLETRQCTYLSYHTVPTPLSQPVLMYDPQTHYIFYGSRSTNINLIAFSLLGRRWHDAFFTSPQRIESSPIIHLENGNHLLIGGHSVNSGHAHAFKAIYSMRTREHLLTLDDEVNEVTPAIINNNEFILPSKDGKTLYRIHSSVPFYDLETVDSCNGYLVGREEILEKDQHVGYMNR